MTFPAQGSIIRTVLVPSDVIYTSLPSGEKFTPSGSMPTSSMTLMIFPELMSITVAALSSSLDTTAILPSGLISKISGSMRIICRELYVCI